MVAIFRPSISALSTVPEAVFAQAMDTPDAAAVCDLQGPGPAGKPPSALPARGRRACQDDRLIIFDLKGRAQARNSKAA